MDSDIKDMKFAKEGKLKIEWADQQMPVVALIRKQFQKSKPLKGITVGGCLHITSETANLARTLKAGGAKVALCASNPLSTQDDVAASLVKDYGIYVSIGVVISNLWTQIELQSIGTFESPEWVTGYNISSHYNSFARIGLSSTTNPLLISFSRLNSINNYYQIRKIYNLVLHYTAFLFMFAAGLLIIASDFFLSFFYGDSYLQFSFIIKLMVSAMISPAFLSIHCFSEDPISINIHGFSKYGP